MNKGDLIRHVKRGTEYEVIAVGPLMTDYIDPQDEDTLVCGPGSRLVKEYRFPAETEIGIQVIDAPDKDADWVLYKALKEPEGDYPQYWLRPLADFEGRFVPAQ